MDDSGPPKVTYGDPGPPGTAGSIFAELGKIYNTFTTFLVQEIPWMKPDVEDSPLSPPGMAQVGQNRGCS